MKFICTWTMGCILHSQMLLLGKPLQFLEYKLPLLYDTAGSMIGFNLERRLTCSGAVETEVATRCIKQDPRTCFLGNHGWPQEDFLRLEARADQHSWLNSCQILGSSQADTRCWSYLHATTHVDMRSDVSLDKEVKTWNLRAQFIHVEYCLVDVFIRRSIRANMFSDVPSSSAYIYRKPRSWLES